MRDADSHLDPLDTPPRHIDPGPGRVLASVVDDFGVGRVVRATPAEAEHLAALETRRRERLARRRAYVAAIDDPKRGGLDPAAFAALVEEFATPVTFPARLPSATPSPSPERA